nr:AAA family ATPase [Haloglycomyces albus]
MEHNTERSDDEEIVTVQRDNAMETGRRPRQGSGGWSPFAPDPSQAPPSLDTEPSRAETPDVWNPDAERVAETPQSPPSLPTESVTPPVEPPSRGDIVRAFPDTPGTLEPINVTADDFARRRVVPPRPPVAETGIRGWAHRLSFGLIALPPGPREHARQLSVEKVRRNFGGLRQVTVVNPKGGAGKTVAALMLATTFGQHRGGYVLAWDNNETQGTLGMRAQQDFHVRTVRDLLRDLDHFRGPTGRVGDLSQYVRAQGGAMFDVLASDESATAGEMLTARAFSDIREAVSRFYKLIVVDTGNNVRASNWQSAIDATDQLVVSMSARNDSAETAARMLDHLEQSGRRDLVRQAVTVVSMPAHRKDVDLPAVQRHFAARTRVVLLAPYEKLLDSGEPIRYEGLSKATSNAWLRIGASVAEGL